MFPIQTHLLQSLSLEFSLYHHHLHMQLPSFWINPTVLFGKCVLKLVILLSIPTVCIQLYIFFALPPTIVLKYRLDATPSHISVINKHE